MSLHAEFAAAVALVRATLGANDVGHFNVAITASGRTETGCDNVKIEYRVGEGSYSYESVTGDSIQACLDEYLRRNGWNQAHAPLALTHDATVS